MSDPAYRAPYRTPILPPPLPLDTIVQYALFYCLDMPPKLFAIESHGSERQHPPPLASAQQPAHE